MKTDPNGLPLVKWVDKYGIIHSYEEGYYPNINGNPLERCMTLLSVVQAQLQELGYIPDSDS